MALVAMSGFALTTIIAKFSYAGGSNPLTLLAARQLFAPLVLGLYFLVSGRSLWLPKRMCRRTLLLGVVLAGNSIGYMSAVNYIPVSLAVLIFYTYPLMVAVMSRLIDRRPLGAVKIAALLGAFVGLALLLRAEAAIDLDWRGVALAVLAALCLGNIFFWSDRLLGQAEASNDGAAAAPVDPLAVKFVMMAGCSVVVLIVFAVMGKAVVPRGAAGPFLIAGFAFTYLVSYVMFFTALPMVGAVKASVLANIEPVVTVGLAVALLGETLAPVQYLGGALILGAILATSLADRGGPRPAAAPAD